MFHQKISPYTNNNFDIQSNVELNKQSDVELEIDEFETE